MLPKKKINGLVEYWVKNSQEKFKTMKSLYNDKRYADCLFYGHMILEMILKAFVVRLTKEQAPKIHNLSRLAELGRIDLTDHELSLIYKTNRFNMEGRYPNERLEFYELCTKSFADEFYQFIITLYKKLCLEIRLKK